MVPGRSSGCAELFALGATMTLLSWVSGLFLGLAMASVRLLPAPLSSAVALAPLLLPAHGAVVLTLACLSQVAVAFVCLYVLYKTPPFPRPCSSPASAWLLAAVRLLAGRGAC